MAGVPRYTAPRPRNNSLARTRGHIYRSGPRVEFRPRPRRIPGAVATPKFSVLTETFDTADTAKWTFGGIYTVTGGRLQFQNPSASAQTVAVYDLVGSSVSVTPYLAALTGSNAGRAGITPNAMGVDAALFEYVPSAGLRFIYRASSSATTLATIPYDPAAHAYWRIAESGGDILWQTSPDAAAWTTQATQTPGWSITALRYRLEGSGAATSEFDNVNVAPPPSGSGTGTWTFAGTGTGKRTPKGSGTGAWSFSGAGSGTRTPKATGTGTWTFAGTATGTRTPKASGSGAWTFAGAGVGTRPAKGAGTGIWTWTGAGVGHSIPVGTGSGTWTFVGAGEGIQPITPGHVPGTAVLAQTLGTAALDGNGTSTATLAAQALGTAVITSVAGTATIQTT